MAYTTINKSTDYFNTKLYTGNNTTDTAITGVGFQPDMSWFKGRNNTENHFLFDAVRGATKRLIPNGNSAEATETNSMKSFNSDGFTLGTMGEVNANSINYASWNWLANGAGSSNTDGSRTTTVSVNTTAGFSIGTCASLATNNDTLGHGLGAVPKMIMVKNTQASGNWFVYHHKLPTGSVGQGSYLTLKATDSYSDGSIWNSTAPTSSVFTMKGGDFATGESLVFYAFAEKTGYSKFGSYVGNGNADGSFIYTGFKPAFMMVKSTGGAQPWVMTDSTRSTYNITSHFLSAESSDAEASFTYFDILSNGFKCRNSSNYVNASGVNYIYMAFAEAPLVGSNNIPCTAR